MDRLEDQLPLTRETKASVVTEYATKEGDTGSPEVQIALLTERIGAIAFARKMSAPSRAAGRSRLIAGSSTPNRPASRRRLPDARQTEFLTREYQVRIGRDLRVDCQYFKKPICITQLFGRNRPNSLIDT